MTGDTNGLSSEQVEALQTRLREAQIAGWFWLAELIAPTVAAMLAEARAEVAQDVQAIPAPGPFDYLADWAQYRSLVLQALARYMPSAVREGGTERSGDVQGGAE